MDNVNQNVRNLPIFKHFSESEVRENVNSFKKRRKTNILDYFISSIRNSWVWIS